MKDIFELEFDGEDTNSKQIPPQISIKKEDLKLKFPHIAKEYFEKEEFYQAYINAKKNTEPLKEADFAVKAVFKDYIKLREKFTDCNTLLEKDEFFSDEEYQIYRNASIKDRMLTLEDFGQNIDHFEKYEEALNNKKLKLQNQPIQAKDMRTIKWFLNYDKKHPGKTSVEEKKKDNLSIDNKMFAYSFNPKNQEFTISKNNSQKNSVVKNSYTEVITGFNFKKSENTNLTASQKNDSNPSEVTGFDIKPNNISINKKEDVFSNKKGFNLLLQKNSISKEKDGRIEVDQTIGQNEGDFIFGRISPSSVINGFVLQEELNDDIVVKPLPEIDFGAFSLINSHQAYLKARQKSEPLTEEDFVSGSASQKLPKTLLKEAFKEYEGVREKCQDYRTPLRKYNFSTDNNFIIYQNALIKEEELTLEDFGGDRFSFRDYKNALNLSYEEEIEIDEYEEEIDEHEEKTGKEEEKSEIKLTKTSTTPISINSNISINTSNIFTSEDRYDTPPPKSSVESRFISKCPPRNCLGSFSPSDSDDKSWRKRIITSHKNEFEKQSIATTPDWANQSDSDENTPNKGQSNHSPSKSPRINENTPNNWQNNVRSPSKSPPNGGIVIPN